MSRCQNSLSSLVSRKLGIAFGRPYRYPWFGKKRQGRGTAGKEKEKDREKGKGKENDWEEEKKRKGRGKEKDWEESGKRKGKGLGRGQEEDWEEERKGKEDEKKRKGNKEERKRIGKGKKRKGRGMGEKTKGVKAEEGKKRKGKRKGFICGLVWAYFLNKWVSLRYRYRGRANFASWMYVTLCKTTSDVDIMHHYIYRYRFWGGPIATQCFLHFPGTRELSLHK